MLPRGSTRLTCCANVPPQGAGVPVPASDDHRRKQRNGQPIIEQLQRCGLPVQAFKTTNATKTAGTTRWRHSSKVLSVSSTIRRWWESCRRMKWNGFRLACCDTARRKDARRHGDSAGAGVVWCQQHAWLMVGETMKQKIGDYGITNYRSLTLHHRERKCRTNQTIIIEHGLGNIPFVILRTAYRSKPY